MNTDKERTIPIIQIELKEIIKYIYSMLDYTVRDYETREKIVAKIQDEVGEQLNAHLYFCTDNNLNNYKIATAQQYINNIFEVMTEYLLNAKDLSKETEFKFYSTDKLKNGSTKESISLESYVADIMSVDGNIYKHYDDNNSATYKIEDFAGEIYDCQFVNDYINYNKIVRTVIETSKLGDKEFTEKELSVLKKGIGYCKNNSIEIDKDIITLYKAYKGFIYFKQPLKETTQPSYEYFDFDNVNHIMALLRFKGDGNFDSDIGCLIYDLNNIIKRTTFTKNQRNILKLYRKYDLTLDDIAKELDVSKQYISNRLQSICKKISTQFWIDYEDWYYTFIKKGTYKKCNVCGRTLLAVDSNFTIDKRNKDGLHRICRECRK